MSDSENRARHSILELVGLVSSTLAGAFIGSLANGNGMGYASFVLFCAMLGGVIWCRRKKPWLSNVGICLLAIVVWWPIGLAIRDAFRNWP